MSYNNLSTVESVTRFIRFVQALKRENHPSLREDETPKEEDLYVCTNCNNKKAVKSSKQLRSNDEEKSEIYTCLQCGYTRIVY